MVQVRKGLKLVSQISTPKVRQNQKGGTEMTHHEQNTAIGQMLEAVIENGLEGLEKAISRLAYQGARKAPIKNASTV
jgi:hypothetical protein